MGLTLRGLSAAAVFLSGLAYAFGPLAPRRFGETFEPDSALPLGAVSGFVLPALVVLAFLVWAW